MSGSGSMRAAGSLLMAACLAGCASTSKSSSSMDGKTYTPPAKKKAAAQSGGSASQLTVTARPADNPSGAASKGQVVLNPGAPAAAQTPTH